MNKDIIERLWEEVAIQESAIEMAMKAKQMTKQIRYEGQREAFLMALRIITTTEEEA